MVLLVSFVVLEEHQRAAEAESKQMGIVHLDL
jgi:hypothetical protein